MVGAAVVEGDVDVLSLCLLDGETELHSLTVIDCDGDGVREPLTDELAVVDGDEEILDSPDAEMDAEPHAVPDDDKDGDAVDDRVA